MAGRRPAEWRFPTPKQRKAEETRAMLLGPDTLTDEDDWWDAVLRDPRARTPRPECDKAMGDINAEMLRVDCRRCGRAVEIKRLDAIRLYTAPARSWRGIGEHLLADGCEHRTGRHEEDGCWPDFR